jgi:septal ring factor EnvC (AmiA/AmiB activator)
MVRPQAELDAANARAAALTTQLEEAAAAAAAEREAAAAAAAAEVAAAAAALSEAQEKSTRLAAELAQVRTMCAAWCGNEAKLRPQLWPLVARVLLPSRFGHDLQGFPHGNGAVVLRRTES